MTSRKPATDSDSLRESQLYDCLARGDTEGSLKEAESWDFWPIDDIGLWLLVESYFQSQRLECVPILEHLLGTRSERDELSVARMEEMIAVAKTWKQV